MSVVKTREELQALIAERKKAAKERDSAKKAKKQARYTKTQALDDLVAEGALIGGTLRQISELIVAKGKEHNCDWRVESIPHINSIMRRKVQKAKTWLVDKSLREHYYYIKA